MTPAPTFYEPEWLRWARRIQALSQSGLAFTQDEYDRERYQQLQSLAADMLAYCSQSPAQAYRAACVEQTGYATPKVDVRGAVFHNNQLLLVRETADQGRWTLPGGWADVNESPSQCVVKEVQEECGLVVRPTKLAAVWDRARHPHRPLYAFHIYKLFFVCDVLGGQLQDSHETSEARFFSLDALPPADTMSVGRVLDYQLQRMVAHYQDPHLTDGV